MSTAVPGPIRRLLRDRPRAIAVALLAGTVLLSAGLQAGAVEALQRTLDAGWRGAYDILVTPPGDAAVAVGAGGAVEHDDEYALVDDDAQVYESINVAARPGDDRPEVDEPTNEQPAEEQEEQPDAPLFFPPNSLGTDPFSGMTLADVAEIAALPGVEVAAPIAQAVMPLEAFDGVSLAIPLDPDRIEAEYELVIAQVRYLTNDGLGERQVTAMYLAFIFDNSSAPIETVLSPEDARARFRNPDSDICWWDDPTTGQRHEAAWDSEEPEAVARCRTWTRAPAVIHALTICGHGSFGSLGELLDGHVLVSLQSPPAINATITLIDPVAERALLGEAGAFLDPLIAQAARPNTDTVREWLAGADLDSARAAALLAQFVEVEEEREEWRHSDYLASIRDELAAIGLFDTPLLLPVIYSAIPQTELRVEVTLMGHGPVDLLPGSMGWQLWGFPGVPLPAGWSNWDISTWDMTAGEPLGIAEGDVSALMDPFRLGEVSIPWADGVDQDTLPTQAPWRTRIGFVNGVALGASEFGVDDNGVWLAPTAYAVTNLTRGGRQWRLDWGPEPVIRWSDGTNLGDEAVFFALGHNERVDGLHVGGFAYTEEQRLERTLAFWRTQMMPTFTPIGQFSLDNVAEHIAALGYVPLGGYSPVGARLVAGPDGTPLPTPIELKPSMSGLGLVNAASTMLAPIGLADVLLPDLGDQVVSAVRVRVAGVDAFAPDALARIAEVRQQIADLGFTATMVAGSSPSPQQVQVLAYAFGVTEAGQAQRVGPLGVIEQYWSELGAAARVGDAVATTTALALAVGLIAAVLLLGAAEVVSVPRRRRDAAVLSLAGWTRPRIVRWFGAEELVVFVVIAAAGLGAWWLASDRDLTRQGAFAALAAVAAVAAATILASLPRRARTQKGAPPSGDNVLTVMPPAPQPPMCDGREPVEHRRTLRGSTVNRFGLLQAALHPAIGLATLLAMATVGVAVTVLGILVVDERIATGASRLADFTTNRLFITRLGFALAALLAGAALATLARRLDAATRTTQFEVLRAMGWTGGERRRAHRAEAAAVVIPCLVAVTTGCAWIAAGNTPADASPWPVAVLGAVAALAIGALTLATPNRLRR